MGRNYNRVFFCDSLGDGDLRNLWVMVNRKVINDIRDYVGFYLISCMWIIEIKRRWILIIVRSMRGRE